MSVATSSVQPPPAPSTPPLSVVVLAAGKGTRMHSALPKVLQTLGDKALLAHVLDTCKALQAQQVIVVTGHQAEQVQAFARQAWTDVGASQPLQCVVQSPQLGTGHAVQQAVPLLPDAGLTLVLCGDVPLIRADTLRQLIALSTQGPQPELTILSAEMDNPHGYGRIVRMPHDAECVQEIVEHKDANAAQLALHEINSGMMVAPTAALKQWLARLDRNNAQGELYLTDVVAHAVADGQRVRALRIHDRWQVEGINSPGQLAQLERALQTRLAQDLMAQGVRLRDPARIDIRGTLTAEADVEIDVNCVFEGQVHVGGGVRIGPHCVLRNVHLAAGVQVQAFSHLDGATVGADAVIGPFARLRPGAVLADAVHIGNFVEIKDSRIGSGSKANHLAYVGNAEVGARVNIGAGSITANYDGANKHTTVIEDDVHIGSNSVLVAPVTIGAGGTVGAGSTITRSTAAQALTVVRGVLKSVANWKRPQKKPKA